MVTESQPKRDPIADLEQCSKVVAEMRAKIKSQVEYIHKLEEAVRNTNEFIVGGSIK